MLYKFYAVSKESDDEIFMTYYSNLDFLISVANQFKGEGHIKKFIIKDENDGIVKEIVCAPKIKKLKQNLY